MAKTDVFDPTQVRRKAIRLFGKEFKVRPATKRVLAGIEELEVELRELPEDATEHSEAVALGRMLEYMLEDSDGLAETIADRWEADDLSLQTLATSAAWVQQQIVGGAQLGNG